METFTWVPDFGADKDVKPTVTQVKFGDGYEQRFAMGLNTKSQTRTLSFTNRNQSESDFIDNFLDARGALEAFLWTPPNESIALIWVCRSWKRTTAKANLYNISAVFEQVYEV